ncbi:rhomboid family intramembrane serine protease [Cereibacter sp. SYSU M97828]|nr:rhomboid family intramembrane serine protease [Cereibacter flavus]
MFPIRDHNPSGQVPYVTYALMAANIAVFLLSWFGLDEAALGWFWVDWGLVPAAVTEGQQLWGFVTSMFLHGGWMHLIGNMLFLWIFGDNLEERFGRARYLGFYLASGLAAGLLQVASDPGSTVPMVGASGAIAGVMGAYLLLFPRAKVDILLILIVFFKVFSIPAWIMLGLWFGLQVFNGLTVPSDMGGVAYWAHAGGFVAGMAMAVPVWLRLGGRRFWQVTHGQPPHPAAVYAPTRIPKITRRG